MHYRVTVPPKAYTHAHKMQVGQFAIVREAFHEGKILLRTYCGFVAVNDPEHTWNNDCCLTVELLPPGTTVTLTSDV